MGLGVCQVVRSVEMARLMHVLLLSAALCAATCSAQPGGSGSADGTKQPAGFSTVIRSVTFALMGVSTIHLVISTLAILRMPRPRCLCYTVPYSDAAMCFGGPCCSCANIRQLSATLVLMWSVALMCELSTGMDAIFLYPYLGFCALHSLTFAVVHVLIRGYQRDEQLMMAQTGHSQQRLHHAAMGLALATGGGGAAANGRAHGSAAAAAGPPPPPPPIQTMSAELVLVLQPDYNYYNGPDGDCGGGLRRYSTPGAGARGGGGGGLEKGTAWALRYTTRAEAVPPASSPAKLTPAPSASLGYGGTDGTGAAPAALSASSEGLGRGGFNGRVSADRVSGGAGDGWGGGWVHGAEEPTQTARIGSEAAVWRTSSGNVWASTTLFAGPAAAPPLASPASPAAAGAGASAHGSCARSISVGLPLRQASGGGGALTLRSSTSYTRLCGTLSKRSSPVPQLQPYASPPYLPPQSTTTATTATSPQGGSPRSPSYQPHQPHQHHQPHPQLHQPQHQHQLQLQWRPPRAPSSCSSSICGGSPTHSRMNPRVDLTLTPTPSSPRPVPAATPGPTTGTSPDPTVRDPAAGSSGPDPGPLPRIDLDIDFRPGADRPEMSQR